MSSTRLTSSGWGRSAPLLTIAALVLVGLVYVTPLGFLSGGARAVRPIEELLLSLPVPPSTKIKPEDTLVKPEDWSSLAAGLEALREKAPEIAPPLGGTTEPNGVPPGPPQPPPTPPLAWKYRGFIQEPGRLVALVQINASQRFLVEGQLLPDDSSPGGSGIRVLTISRSLLIVDRNGKNEEIALEHAGTEANLERRLGPTSRRGN